jgi:two-component system response regulator AtoC
MNHITQIVMNLLVIDDDKEFLFLISNALKKHGYTVYTSSNGVNALDILGEKPVDLIISDVIMSDTPIMSLTCTLKNLYPKIPIILVSGLPAEPLIHNSLTLGASEFLPKPLNMGTLYSAIERLSHAA